ncbi:MAG: SRPBCC family protein [Bacteroidales bacterium]|nr:SRPBCC family protein [Bacteroidales bacterium]
METKYESAIKVVTNSASVIYNKLADFQNFNGVIPQDKVQNWEATRDTCRFSIDNMGEIGLRIADREENACVKYTADGATRFNFNIWVQMKEVEPYNSRIKVTLKADLNPMIKMMVGSQLQKFVDMLAESIALHPYY